MGGRTRAGWDKLASGYPQDSGPARVFWGLRGALNLSCYPGTFYLEPQIQGDPQSRESLGGSVGRQALDREPLRAAPQWSRAPASLAQGQSVASPGVSHQQRAVALFTPRVTLALEPVVPGWGRGGSWGGSWWGWAVPGHMGSWSHAAGFLGLAPLGCEVGGRHGHTWLAGPPSGSGSVSWPEVRLLGGCLGRCASLTPLFCVLSEQTDPSPALPVRPSPRGVSAAGGASWPLLPAVRLAGLIWLIWAVGFWDPGSGEGS